MPNIRILEIKAAKSKSEDARNQENISIQEQVENWLEQSYRVVGYHFSDTDRVHRFVLQKGV